MGEIYALEQAETILGRSRGAGIQLLDPGVSREHAAILLEEETYTIEDLHSTNGIRVNRKRVRSTVLTDGDLIQLGATILRFQR